MKAGNNLKKAYIERNAEILKLAAHYIDKGKVMREFFPIVANHFEVSASMVNSLLYHPHYPYYTEAREFIKEELAEMEKQGKEVSPALAKLVSYEPQNTTTVPN